MEIALGGRDVRVPEHLRAGVEVHAEGEKGGPAGVAEGVGVERLSHPELLAQVGQVSLDEAYRGTPSPARYEEGVLPG